MNTYNNSNKDDKEKVRLELIDPNFILGIGDVLTFGAKKYTDREWTSIEDKHNRNYASLLRHVMAWRTGEKEDKESGKSHLLHAAYNCMVLYYDDMNGGN